MQFVVLLSAFIVCLSSSSGFKIEHVMEKHEVVPDVIDEAPSEVLTVKYGDITLKPGKTLTPTQVKDAPEVDWKAESDTFYTLLMTDPDAPSRDDPTFREWQHWLIGNIPGNDVGNGKTMSEYIGAGPPKDTGLHRYVFLLFKQTGEIEFDEHTLISTSTQHRALFSTRDFMSKYKGLLELVAGNLFQAEYDSYVDILYQQFTD